MSSVSPLAPGLSLSSHLPIYLSTPAALDKPGGTTLQTGDKLEGVWVLQKEDNTQALQSPHLLETDARKSRTTDVLAHPDFKFCPMIPGSTFGALKYY